VTAPNPKVTLAPEVYAYFKVYHRRNLAWGIYHVYLDDGNYRLTPPEVPYGDDRVTDEDRRMWDLFRQMTPSQRARLAKRC